MILVVVVVRAGAPRLLKEESEMIPARSGSFAAYMIAVAAPIERPQSAT